MVAQFLSPGKDKPLLVMGQSCAGPADGDLERIPKNEKLKEGDKITLFAAKQPE